jgi:hypothetical protein
MLPPNATLQQVVGTLGTAARLPDAVKLELLAEESVVDRAQRLQRLLDAMGSTVGRTPPPPPTDIGRN